MIHALRHYQLVKGFIQPKKRSSHLLSNYSVCEKRVRLLARWFAHTPDILQAYSDIISEQETRGFIKQHLLHIVSMYALHSTQSSEKELATTSIRIHTL